MLITLIGLGVIFSCSLNKKEELSPDDLRFSHALIENIWNSSISSDSLELVIKEMNAFQNSNTTEEQKIYLKCAGILLKNQGVNADKKAEILELTLSVEYMNYSAFLKYSMRYFLYMIDVDNKDYILGLDQLLLGTLELEDSSVPYPEYLLKSYSSIAYLSSNYLGETDKSIIAFTKALAISKELNDTENESRLHYNISLEYFERQEYKEAVEHIEPSIALANSLSGDKKKWLWTAFYPAYINSISHLDQKERIKEIYTIAENKLLSDSLTDDVYNTFVHSTLEGLAIIGLNEELLEQTQRLSTIYPDECTNQFELSHIYNSLALYYQKASDSKERQAQINKLENAYCDLSVKYFRVEYSEALNRLIEIDKQANNSEMLNRWYEKKSFFSKYQKDKIRANNKQINYWFSKDLKIAQREVSLNKKLYNASKNLNIFVILFVLCLLALIWKIRNLNNSLLEKKKVLKVINRDVLEKNTLLNEAYQIQSSQKNELQEQNHQLEEAKTIIERKTIELEGDLKSQLLLLSNNKKVYNKLLEEMDNRIKTAETKKYLKGIIKESQNESIWDEIDYKFLQMNEVFFNALSSHFPGLTKNDLKLCALIRMNLSNKEMARIQYVSDGSIKVSKYRLKKKLNLENTDINILTFLNSIDIKAREN